MNCKLTDKKGKFVKAHIIPKSFFNVKKDNADNLLIDGRKNLRPKRAPIGVYDKTILVKDGEQYFQKLDDYGARTLLQDRNNFRNFSPIKGEKGKVLDKNDYDLKKLKIFFLSVLWRASVSNHDGFRKINLGEKYEKLIKNIILKNDLENDNFDIYLFRFDHSAFKKGTILLPIRSKINGVNFYKIYLAEYIVHIKIDNKPINKALRHITINTNRDLLIYDKDYLKSKEKEAIEKMMDDKETDLPKWFIKKAKV